MKKVEGVLLEQQTGADADVLEPGRRHRQPGPFLPGDRRGAVGHPADTKGQEIMRKLALALAAVLLLAGCFSSPAKRYFQIVPIGQEPRASSPGRAGSSTSSPSASTPSTTTSGSSTGSRLSS
ncbi:MAG: hypothetical protein MZV64_12540 [Ignavibacteriales bacterium]|nr:hypothetical protein [Ignavibacteriales bacterium]